MKRILSFIAALAIIGSCISCKSKINEDSTEVKTETIQDAPEGLYISEVSSNNTYWNSISDGTYPDWVEIYNGTGSAVSMRGYTLSDSENNLEKFKFPDVSIKNGEYLVIYCTGNENIENTSELCAGFSVSSKGEKVGLYKSNEPVSVVDVPALPEDVTYGMDSDGTYKYFAIPTPGESNSVKSSTEPYFEGNIIETGIIINEYMDKNLYSIIDEDGDRFNWVEIKNIGNEAVNLNGFSLSDNPDNSKKWCFPDVELKPGELRIVFLSGKNKIGKNGELHASFKLGSEDKQLVLFESRGKRTDCVNVERLSYGNVSIGRSTDDISKWLYYASPTPGADNTTKGFERIDKNEEVYLPDVSING